MSKIGKRPIAIPEGVDVKVNGDVLNVKGKLGELSLKILDGTKVEIQDNKIVVSPLNENKQTIANWGTMAALANNAVIGVKDGFEKILEIEGVGYRAAMEGNNLVLSIGFSHPVKMAPREGVKIAVEKNTIKISGIDRFLVGQMAAEIRAKKKPEPYKGKGIKYKGEVIRRKEGKKAAGATK
ncbi:MAG: 50S ribosomal protein L6 [Patescibacteria group bacterium]|nr:50S ribosomal protein L6 [Patescibacteria group bacterium]